MANFVLCEILYFIASKLRADMYGGFCSVAVLLHGDVLALLRLMSLLQLFHMWWLQIMLSQ